MSTDFKALCAELAGCLDDALTFTVQGDTERSMRQLIARARAALAQPEPEGVTLDCDEIDVPAWHRGDDFHVYKEGYSAGWAEGVKAATARFARNVAGELAQILRERHSGSSQVADWLEGMQP